VASNSTFVTELDAKIQSYTNQYGRYATPLFWLKAILLLGSWFSVYIYLVFYAEGSILLHFSLGVLWGIVSLLIIFNIGHDAVHKTVSKNKTMNRVLGYSFNLVGGNAYSWELKHNLAHHIHTNIEGMDFDTDMDPLLRLSTETPYRNYYKWQVIWLIPIYSLLSLLIIFVADFKIFFQTKKAGLVAKHPIKEWMILVASKLFYVCIALVLPMYYSSFETTQIITTFFVFHLMNGLIIACVFMPSHYFPKSKFFASRTKDMDWYDHQLQTTMDLSPNSFIVSSILGGLNLNVAHHLYPHFCHTHYFKLSKIIRDHCEDSNVECHQMSYPSALVNHIIHIKQLSVEHV
jgi:linoleoyl-CoA desaturase